MSLPINDLYYTFHLQAQHFPWNTILNFPMFLMKHWRLILTASKEYMLVKLVEKQKSLIPTWDIMLNPDIILQDISVQIVENDFK